MKLNFSVMDVPSRRFCVRHFFPTLKGKDLSKQFGEFEVGDEVIVNKLRAFIQADQLASVVRLLFMATDFTKEAVFTKLTDEEISCLVSAANAAFFKRLCNQITVTETLGSQKFIELCLSWARVSVFRDNPTVKSLFVQAGGNRKDLEASAAVPAPEPEPAPTPDIRALSPQTLALGLASASLPLALAVVPSLQTLQVELQEQPNISLKLTDDNRMSMSAFYMMASAFGFNLPFSHAARVFCFDEDECVDGDLLVTLPYTVIHGAFCCFVSGLNTEYYAESVNYLRENMVKFLFLETENPLGAMYETLSQGTIKALIEINSMRFVLHALSFEQYKNLSLSWSSICPSTETILSQCASVRAEEGVSFQLILSRDEFLIEILRDVDVIHPFPELFRNAATREALVSGEAVSFCVPYLAIEEMLWYLVTSANRSVFSVIAAVELLFTKTASVAELFVYQKLTLATREMLIAIPGMQAVIIGLSDEQCEKLLHEWSGTLCSTPILSRYMSGRVSCASVSGRNVLHPPFWRPRQFVRPSNVLAIIESFWTDRDFIGHLVNLMENGRQIFECSSSSKIFLGRFIYIIYDPDNGSPVLNFFRKNSQHIQISCSEAQLTVTFCEHKVAVSGKNNLAVIKEAWSYISFVPFFRFYIKMLVKSLLTEAQLSLPGYTISENSGAESPYNAPLFLRRLSDGLVIENSTVCVAFDSLLQMKVTSKIASSFVDPPVILENDPYYFWILAEFTRCLGDWMGSHHDELFQGSSHLAPRMNAP